MGWCRRAVGSHMARANNIHAPEAITCHEEVKCSEITSHYRRGLIVCENGALR